MKQIRWYLIVLTGLFLLPQLVHAEIIEMINIPGGTFSMGSHDDKVPVHRVHIKAFKMGKYEITQAQWKAVMGSNPSYFKGDNLPVENVSWDDIQKYIHKLDRETRLHFRLPSESEWEYSTRAGSITRWFWGDDFFQRVMLMHGMQKTLEKKHILLGGRNLIPLVFMM